MNTNFTNVYIVSKGEDYEGSTILGVFSTFANAKKRAQLEIETFNGECDDVEIGGDGDDHITWHYKCNYISVEPYILDK